MLIPGRIEISFQGLYKDHILVNSENEIINFIGPINLKIEDSFIKMSFNMCFPLLNHDVQIEFNLSAKQGEENVISSYDTFVILKSSILYHKSDSIISGMIGFMKDNIREDFDFVAIFPDFNLKNFEKKIDFPVWDLAHESL